MAAAGAPVSLLHPATAPTHPKVSDQPAPAAAPQAWVTGLSLPAGRSQRTGVSRRGVPPTRGTPAPQGASARPCWVPRPTSPTPTSESPKAARPLSGPITAPRPRRQPLVLFFSALCVRLPPASLPAVSRAPPRCRPGTRAPGTWGPAPFPAPVPGRFLLLLRLPRLLLQLAARFPTALISGEASGG